MRWLLRALEQAGRNDEVIPILERETAQTQCYMELVKKLVESGRTDKAREWAKEGFIETLENAPGIAWQLEEQLREMAAREKNTPLVASYRAMEFFDKPCLQSYSELHKAASKALVWDTIRDPILKYLETGRRPDAAPDIVENPARRKRRKLQETPPEGSMPCAWPLPVPEFPPVRRDGRWTRFPDISTLTDIAIKEGRHDDALRWYRQGQQPGAYGNDSMGANVAQAVSKTHPDDAIAIWKNLVSMEIAHAKPAAYQTAGSYLTKIRSVYTQTERSDEWRAYIADLRLRNNRRPRMLDVLNSLEGRRTPIVR
jgi:uncharacterized Zn finger protein